MKIIVIKDNKDLPLNYIDFGKDNIQINIHLEEMIKCITDK